MGHFFRRRKDRQGKGPRVARRILVALVVLSFGMACERGAGENMTSRPFDSAYHTDGSWIRDRQNRIVIFRGVNVGGRAKLPPFLPLERAEDVDQIATWGVNLVRFVMTWEGVEPEPDEYDDAYLAKVEEQVGWFHERGIEVFLDFHQDLYSRLYCGDGAPLWATPEDHRARAGEGSSGAPGHEVAIFDCGDKWFTFYLTPEVSQAWDRFWNNEDGLQDHYARAFRRVAKHFRDHTAVIGYEIMNEPYPGTLKGTGGGVERDKIMPFYRKVAEAIREGDPHSLILYEPAVTSTIFLQSEVDHLGLDNIVLSPHFYVIAGLTGSAPYDQTEKQLERGIGFVHGLAEGLGIPMILGEYGAHPSMENGYRLITDYYRELDEPFLSGTIWHYDTSVPEWNDEGVSLVDPDRTERPYVEAIIRPYARRIAGVPLEMRFDPESRVFTLVFQRDESVTGPTVIYLPSSRIYPAGFDATTTRAGEMDAPGRLVWDETRSELNHSGGVTGERIEITVRARSG